MVICCALLQLSLHPNKMRFPTIEQAGPPESVKGGGQKYDFEGLVDIHFDVIIKCRLKAESATRACTAVITTQTPIDSAMLAANFCDNPSPESIWQYDVDDAGP